MDDNTTTKIKFGLVIVFLLIFAFVFLYRDSKKTIQILYFFNPKCKVANVADESIAETQEKFQEKIEIRRFFVNMYEGDPEDSKEVKELRDKYHINGTPVIIVNGKEFKEEFTFENLKKEICRNFLIKPRVCF
jgi:thiol-disulfide isomerase/thioredoxin